MIPRHCPGRDVGDGRNGGGGDDGRKASRRSFPLREVGCENEQRNHDDSATDAEETRQEPGDNSDRDNDGKAGTKCGHGCQPNGGE